MKIVRINQRVATEQSAVFDLFDVSKEIIRVIGASRGQDSLRASGRRMARS
jgi:hypothetical protein